MSKWTHLTISITEEEKEELTQFMKDYNEKKNKNFVFNSFVRTILFSLKTKFYKIHNK